MHKLLKFALSNPNLIKGGTNTTEFEDEFGIWSSGLSTEEVKAIQIKMNFVPDALMLYFRTYVYQG